MCLDRRFRRRHDGREYTRAMKNPPFSYHRPATVDEALGLLAEHNSEAKVLAGGQSLLPVMALRLGHPGHIIDIGAIEELGKISVGDGLTIGAMVRHSEAERSSEVAEHAPLVATAMGHVGHRAIRNRGTVVGSIAHADAAAEMPAVCLATGATMHIASTDGVREVQAADFFQGYFTTALEDHELLIAVSFPGWSATAGGSVVEVSRRNSDYAMCGLACVLDAPQGTIESAALSFFSVASAPIRVAEAEASLVGKPVGEQAFSEAAAVVTSTLSTSADIHATANYRRHVAGVLTGKGLAEAAAKIGALQ